MSTIILVNATSCVVGGGVQVADTVVRRLALVRHPGVEWAFALSREVAQSLGADVLGGLRHITFDGSPGQLIGGCSTRRGLCRFERDCEAAAVFTILGPSYVAFRSPELMGFANGFMLASGDEHLRNHPWRRRLVSRAKKYLRRRFLLRAQQHWVETEFARQALAGFLGRDPSLIHVVPNCVNPQVARLLEGGNAPRGNDIIFLGAGYWHKNHLLLPKVAEMLSALPGLPTDWRFVVTLRESAPVYRVFQEDVARRGLGHRFHNLGQVGLQECAASLRNARLAIHPSLLETFSVTYLECMLFGLPLLASDRPFAREVCGDGAAYFDPVDPASAARLVASALLDPRLREDLASKGRARAATFPDWTRKADLLADLAMNFALGRRTAH